MKNRAYFLMLAATTLLSAPASAAPIFMLQFGSFETRAEAETRLSTLKSEHGGIINGMQSGIREVTLPPDNLVVYRTQAGPVDTRAQAQSICSQLASNGDECYVVETAMAPSFVTPTTQVAQAAPAASAPAPQAVVQPNATQVAQAPVTSQATKLAAAPQPMMAAPAPLVATAPTTPSTAPVAASAPKTASSASVNAPSATSTTALAMQQAAVAPQAVPPVQLSPLPTRDPQNTAAISRVTAAPVTAKTAGVAPVAVMGATAAPSSSMQQAMDQAVKEQNENLSAREKAIKAAPTPAGAKEEGTFWSRLNPFSDDDEEETVAKAAPATQAPVPAPVPVPASAPNQHVAAVAPMPVMAPTPTPPAPAPMLVPVPQANASAPAAMPLPASAPMLPPPPAPLTGKGAITPAPTAQASMPAPMPVIVPEPTGTLNTPKVPDPIIITDVPGNVRVGEAQRVPLTQATAPAPMPAMPVPPAPQVLTPGAPAVSLHPNATLGQKTLWAHVGQFVDAQAALAFWDQYRHSHPDFPVVRVRVTSPLQSLNRGNDQVSLRVGPFAKESSIGNLCKTIQDGQQANKAPRLMCGPITDMGIANRIGGGNSGYLPGSRYNR